MPDADFNLADSKRQGECKQQNGDILSNLGYQWEKYLQYTGP